MSNEAILIANDIPGGVGGEVGEDPTGQDGVASGPHAVPVYWLSLFDETHLLTVEVEGEDGTGVAVPSLVAEMSVARRLLGERRESLSEAFPEFQSTWDRFAKVIHQLKARYIKVDLLELWDLAAAVDEDFESEVRAAIRWFESRDEADFARLLSVAGIRSYDKTRRTFDAVGSDVPRAFHLRGYANNDKYWDDKSDT
jgi:hypothetical protein